MESEGDRKDMRAGERERERDRGRQYEGEEWREGERECGSQY
jgi:hypothetical protein